MGTKRIVFDNEFYGKLSELATKHAQVEAVVENNKWKASFKDLVQYLEYGISIHIKELKDFAANNMLGHAWLEEVRLLAYEDILCEVRDYIKDCEE